MIPRFANEDEFTAAIIDLAMTLQWRVHHQRPCRTSKGYRSLVQGHTGLPDIIAAKHGTVHFWELKIGANKLRHDQKAWADHLGPTWRCLYPSDWDWIVQTLKGQ